jgi:hypothetical protein
MIEAVDERLKTIRVFAQIVFANRHSSALPGREQSSHSSKSGEIFMIAVFRLPIPFACYERRP